MAPSSEDGSSASEIARFLARYPPFRELEAGRVEELAAKIRLETYPAAAIILRQTAAPGGTTALGPTWDTLPTSAGSSGYRDGCPPSSVLSWRRAWIRSTSATSEGCRSAT